MNRFAQRVCALGLFVLGAVNAFGADTGWYVGAGLGPSKTNIDDASIANELAIQSPTNSIQGINQDNKSTMYKVFLGYNVMSFLALEASMFQLGKFAFNANTNTAGTLSPSGTFSGISRSGAAASMWWVSSPFSSGACLAESAPSTGNRRSA